MARQIIMLEDVTPNRGASEPLIYRYAMWLSVPSARQAFYANASATSAVSKGPNAATAGELTAIQNGSILEVVETINVIGMNLAQIEAALVARFTQAQTFLNGQGSNSWDHYGTFWDGATWTLNTVG